MAISNCFARIIKPTSTPFLHNIHTFIAMLIRMYTHRGLVAFQKPLAFTISIEIIFPTHHDSCLNKRERDTKRDEHI